MTIARHFDVSMKELEEVNKLGSGASLHAGAILFIPNKTITATASNDVQNVVDNQSRGRVQANNRTDGSGFVPVAMNPAVLEVEAPRALPVTQAPAPRPVAPARPQVAQQTPPPAPPSGSDETCSRADEKAAARCARGREILHLPKGRYRLPGRQTLRDQPPETTSDERHHRCA